MGVARARLRREPARRARRSRGRARSAAAARLVGAAEASNARGAEIGGKPGPSSRDVELDEPVPAWRASSTGRRRGRARCRPGCRAPARRVAVGVELELVVARLEISRPSVLGARREARRRVARAARAATPSRRIGSGPGRRGRSAAGPRRAATAARVSSAAERSALLELLARARPPQRELELGPQQGERRAQLVARVGDEAALVLDGRLRGGRACRSASPRAGGSRRAPAAPAALPGVAGRDRGCARRRIASTGRSAPAASP